MPKTLPPAFTIIPPGRPLSGRVSPPGSKSITNRALLLAALAKGTSRLTGALKSKDTVLMAEALRQMGVVVEEPDATSFLVTSSGKLMAPAAPLFLGNAGTATRFLTAAVATIEGTVIVDGDEDMRLRPIKPLVDALSALGIDATAPTGCPPVTIHGTGRFGKGRVEIDASLSSQYVSALLMAAPFGGGPIEVALAGQDIGARGYVDLTLAAMRAFGAKVEETSPGTWNVEPTGYVATDFHIEPDASAATYLWGIEALTGGKIDLGVADNAFTQPDAAAQAVIAQFRICLKSSTDRRCRTPCLPWRLSRPSTTSPCASSALPICASRKPTAFAPSPMSSTASGPVSPGKRATICWWRRIRHCSRRPSAMRPRASKPITIIVLP